VTFYTIEEPYYLGRQATLYNKYLKPKIDSKEIRWLLICDLDEFVWSTRCRDLKNILKNSESLAQIQFDVNLFGSNGHIKQPKYIIPNFTKRASYPTGTQNYRNFKYIINSDFKFKSLNVHSANFENEQDKLKFIRSDYIVDKEKPWFVLNHYMIQSQDFWKKIKLGREDADNYRINENKRNMEEFFIHDYKDEEDLRLYEQNKELYDRFLKEDGGKIDDYIDL
jgi:hypothetical protein